jgi:hypothetical protein
MNSGQILSTPFHDTFVSLTHDFSATTLCKRPSLSARKVRHGPRTENTAPLMLRAILLGFPRERYLASPLARLLLPSNRKHSSYCCLYVFRAWLRDGRPSTVACTSRGEFTKSLSNNALSKSVTILRELQGMRT